MQEMSKHVQRVRVPHITIHETAGHQWEVFADGTRVEGRMFRKLCEAVEYVDDQNWTVQEINYWQP